MPVRDWRFAMLAAVTSSRAAEAAPTKSTGARVLERTVVPAYKGVSAMNNEEKPTQCP